MKGIEIQQGDRADSATAYSPRDWPVGLHSPDTLALGLGANLGDPAERLRRAVRELERWIRAPRLSPVYRSRPISPISQPDFLNLVVLGKCSLAPAELLRRLKELERRAGREPGPRFGPRPLDIDILLHGDALSNSPELTLPHPRMVERRFVLAPLADIAPDIPIPPDGRSAAEHLSKLDGLPDRGGQVERLGDLVAL